jgi:predicted O-methyltransferase YrrM
MKNLLQKGDMLPFTFMSLRPFAMAFAINEILVNKRRMVIELGSGASTIILARAIRIYGLNCRLVSVESDEAWLNQTGQILVHEGLSDIVQLIHAPLVLKDFKGKSIHWYDELTLKENLRSLSGFDMVVVDGPAAYENDHELSRYFALPFLVNKMAPDHCIFLDDANRAGERKVMDLWNSEFGKKFTLFAETLGVHYSGKFLDCSPLKFVDKR